MTVKAKGGLVKTGYVAGKPKLTRQGMGKGTKYSSTSVTRLEKYIEVKVSKRKSLNNFKLIASHRKCQKQCQK
jgi:hypothetical protein